MKVAQKSCALNLAELTQVITHELRDVVRQSLDTSLSLIQIRTLAIVERMSGVGVSDIADHVGLGVSATSTLIEGLVQRGCLMRTGATEDRRRVVVELTATGTEMLTEARQIYRDHLVDRLSDLSDAELSTINSATTILLKIFANQPTAGATR